MDRINAPDGLLRPGERQNLGPVLEPDLVLVVGDDLRDVAQLAVLALDPAEQSLRLALGPRDDDSGGAGDIDRLL
jgi:hypothetical protein